MTLITQTFLRLHELLAHAVRVGLGDDLQHVVAHRLAQGAALTDDDFITLLGLKSGGAVHREGAVALLITLVLVDEVKVVSADDDRSVHLRRVDDTAQNAPADDDVAREGALLVDVLTVGSSLGGLEAKTDLLAVADAARSVEITLARLVHVLIHSRLALVGLLVLNGRIHGVGAEVLKLRTHYESKKIKVLFFPIRINKYKN